MTTYTPHLQTLAWHEVLRGLQPRPNSCLLFGLPPMVDSTTARDLQPANTYGYYPAERTLAIPTTPSNVPAAPALMQQQLQESDQLDAKNADCLNSLLLQSVGNIQPKPLGSATFHYQTVTFCMHAYFQVLANKVHNDMGDAAVSHLLSHPPCNICNDLL